MKITNLFIFVFIIVAHIHELKSILKDIEKMHDQLQQMNKHIEDLKKQPAHLQDYVDLANEIKP